MLLVELSGRVAGVETDTVAVRVVVPVSVSEVGDTVQVM